MSVNFTTPVGRMVQGDPYIAQPRKDATGKPKIYPVGHANAGQAETQFFAAVAVPKNDPLWPAFREALMVEQRAAWPQFHDANGNCTNPTFADKITDGDGADSKGQSYATREGWAGCWIVKCASQFAPTVFERGPAGWMQTAPGKVKLGDYVMISGTCQSNQSAQSPGMYMNLNMVAMDREGERIVMGPTAEQAFGTGAAGAAAAPPAPTPTPPPPPAPAAPAAPAAAHDPLAAAVADGWIKHPTSPGYHYKGQDVLTDADLAARYPAAPAAPSPPPAPSYPITEKAAGPVMLPAAKGTTYEAFIAKGWTDAQLIANGMMQAPAA
jgi:hypothetical protein